VNRKVSLVGLLNNLENYLTGLYALLVYIILSNDHKSFKGILAFSIKNPETIMASPIYHISPIDMCVKPEYNLY
jgi:hypothetical protein